MDNSLPRAELLLWPHKVDYGLYADSYQGDEDQRPGHRLVAGVQVATDGEEYGPQGEKKHPSSTLLSTTPTKKQVASSNPDPTLKLDFTQRGAPLSSNSRTPSYLPNTDSLAIITSQPPTLERRK